MERNVLHLDLEDFPVAVERIADPALRGKAVLISPPGARSRIFWASSEARSFGADRGMFLGEAMRRCRGARIINPNERLYVKMRENVLQIVGRYSPLSEPSDVGRAFVDLSGTNRLFGPPRDTAHRIHREILKEIGLSTHLGLSSNKSTSEVASVVVDEELLDVAPGSEETFLAPQPARFLPGVEEIEPGLVEELNIRRISQFARMTPSQLALVFGRIGPLLHYRARGFDPRPVRPPEKKPSVIEELTLPRDTNDREELTQHLYRLMESCAFRLRAQNRLAGVVEFFLSYSDNLHEEGRVRIHPPSNLDASLFPALRGLFQRILSRRVRVSYLRVSFSDLIKGGTQLGLFAEARRSNREGDLVRALDAIRTRHGVAAIFRGGNACPASSI